MKLKVSEPININHFYVVSIISYCGIKSAIGGIVDIFEKQAEQIRTVFLLSFAGFALAVYESQNQTTNRKAIVLE
jgi:hypothetical protein